MGGRGADRGGRGRGRASLPGSLSRVVRHPSPSCQSGGGVEKKRESRLTARRIEGRGVVVAHVVRPPRRGVRRQEVRVVPVGGFVRASARHDVVLTSGLGAEDGAETAKKGVAKKTFVAVCLFVVAHKRKNVFSIVFFWPNNLTHTHTHIIY